MKTEIFIENHRLDITEDISTLLNFSIDDIKEFASRNTSFSKTIVLPGTANNNLLFGHIFDFTVSNSFDSALDNVSTNYNAAKSADCLIFKDHIQVFKGVIRVMKIVIMNKIPEYECAVFGELGGMIAKIGSLKLEDLDFSAYDTIWTASGITATWPNYNQGSGLYFPLIDHGGVSTDKVDYDIRAMRPALYVKEYLDKIIENAGYSYSSNLFQTSRFKSLIVPHNKKNLQRQSTSLVEALITSNVNVLQGATATNRVAWQTVDVNLFTASDSNRRFTYNGADPITVNLHWDLRGVRHSLSSNFAFNVQKNGVSIAGTAQNLNSNHGTFNIPFYWFGTTTISLATNDYVELQMVATTGGSDLDFLVQVQLADFEIESTTPVWVDIGVGDPITINDTIPRNILQKDFFSSMLRLFNLYVYEDKLRSKFLYIEPYVNFYNVSGITDWTMKLDRTKAIELTPMSQLTSRYYNFSFKPDVDYYNDLYKKRYNENYGDYIYDSQYEFANEKENIELIFSPSVLVGYVGVDKIVTAIYKLNAGVEERIDTNIRILQAFNVTGVTAWDILDDVTTLESGLTNYGYAGHYNDPDAPANDIHFGVPRELFFTVVSGSINVTQFNVYWSPYMAEITDKDSKLLRGSFKLDPKDIYDLDFSKFVFLDNTYWRLNKVEDWNSPELNKCELLKVIFPVY